MLTVEPLSAQSAWKKWLKFFGILPLTLHEAVLSGSVAHVKAAILKFQKGKRAQPALVDAYDVCKHSVCKYVYASVSRTLKYYMLHSFYLLPLMLITSYTCMYILCRRTVRRPYY